MKILNVKYIVLIIVSTLNCYLGYSFSASQSNVNDTIIKQSPNVIIIFMDDMGYGDLSSYGHPTIQTPNIDRLAAEGQKWTNFYAASSVCSPSRGALMTGRYPVRLGLGGEKERVFFPESIGGLPASEITIAEMLKAKGYATGMIGKWHLGHLPEFLPTSHGFDSYYGIPYSNDMDAIKWSVENLLSEPDYTMWNVPLMQNETIIERPTNQFTITKRYTEKTIDFLNENKEKPFFLYLAHTMVHTPLFVSDEFKNTSARGLFGDVMNEIDWSVGQIIATLKKLKIEKNTLVIFTSDNGPWLMMQENGGSAGLLKDGKGTTWEGGMRVPGIFYMPGTIPSGTIEDMGATLDILPTVAAFTGAKLPQDVVLDGFDLSDVLKEKKASQRNHFVYYRKQEIYAVRRGAYKAHYITQNCYTDNDEKTILETPILFNVNVDPSEKYNCANKHPEELEVINLLVKQYKETIKIRTSELDKYPN